MPFLRYLHHFSFGNAFVAALVSMMIFIYMSHRFLNESSIYCACWNMVRMVVNGGSIPYNENLVALPRLAGSPTAGSPWGKFSHSFSCSTPSTDGVSDFFLSLLKGSRTIATAERFSRKLKEEGRKVETRGRNTSPHGAPSTGHLPLLVCRHAYAETCRRDENTRA